MEGDGSERKEFDRQMNELDKASKRTADTMMNSMVEAMAPMLGGSQLLQQEAQAWDQHACAFVKQLSKLDIVGETPAATIVSSLACEYADAMLALRRERFNQEVFMEQLRGLLPSGKHLCNRPILRDSGADTGLKCTQNEGHVGVCI